MLSSRPKPCGLQDDNLCTYLKVAIDIILVYNDPSGFSLGYYKLR
jgi:hypothetical protein